MFCSNCACEIPTTAKFCVRCGSTVDALASSTLARAVAPSVANPAPKASVQCSKCGGQNPSEYFFCTACGASLGPIGSPVFVSSTVTAFDAVLPPSAPVKTVNEIQNIPDTQQVASTLRGVGGWLLFFCIGLIFVAPLIDAAEILKNPNNMFVVVLDLGLAAFAIYTGIIVWGTRPNALKVVKAYFIVMIVLAFLTILGVIFADAKDIQGHSNSQGEDMIAALRSLGYVAIWWSYFGSSERVRATFGSNL
jgi:hypothetical protein